MTDLLALMPFATTLGIELDPATPDEAVGRLAWAPERCTAGGIMHGGPLMSLADTVGAVCAFLNLPEGATRATTSSSTNLFRSPLPLWCGQFPGRKMATPGGKRL